MATFIQGSTDFIPQIQPWSPDFNFYQNVMATKQSQYDAGWEKTNTLYNSLLNAPMLREDDIAKRDQFFNTIEQDINRLSGIDLSKQQNVDAAAQLFTPIIEDKGIINDIAKTKQLSNEMQIMEGYRNCMDPKKCGGKYWEEGGRALNYWAEDFKNASADDALGMSGPKYTPYTNAVEKAFDKLFTNSGKIGTSITYSDGKFMVTEKNNANIIQPLMSYIAGTVGNDPAVRAMYKTKAYVARKDWMHSNAGQYGSTEEAEADYMQSVLHPATSTINKAYNEVADTRRTREIEKEILDEDIRNNGIVPGSKDANTYNDVLNSLGTLLESEETLKVQADVANNIPNSNNLNAMRFNTDAAVAEAMLFNDMLGAAQTYQQLTHEIKQGGADPYALARYNSGLRMDEAKAKFIMEAEYDVWKDEQKAIKEAQSSKGTLWDNMFGIKDPDDNNVAVTEEYDASESDDKFEQEALAKLVAPESEYLASMWNNLFSLLPTKEGESFRDASRPVVNDFMNIFINEIGKNPEKYLRDEGVQKLFGEDLLVDILTNKDNIRSMPNKILSRLNKNNKASITSDDLIALPTDLLKAMYTQSEKSLNPENGINSKKAYANELYSLKNMQDLRQNIKFANATVDTYKNLKAKRHKEVKPGWLTFVKSGNPAINTGGHIGGMYGGYDDESEGLAYNFQTTSAGMGGPRDMTINKRKFIDKGADIFRNDDGDKLPYDEWEDEMLRSSLIWYDDYQNGKPVTEEQFASNRNLFRASAAGESSELDRTIAKAKKNMHKLYYGEDEQTTWEKTTSGFANMFGIASRYVKADMNDKRAIAKRGEERGVGYGLDDLDRFYWSSNEPGVQAVNSIGGGVGGEYSGKSLTAYGINGSKYTSEKYLGGLSLLTNIIENSDDILVANMDYANSTGLGQNAGEVLTKLKSFGRDFYGTKYEDDDEYIPTFDIEYDANYAFNNPDGESINRDYVKVKINFDDNWIEEQDWVLGDNDDKQAIKRNRAKIADQGVVLFMPKAVADNAFETSANRSDIDKLLNSGADIKFKDYVPNIGSLSLEARSKFGGPNERGYSIKGDVDVFNPETGKYVSRALNTFEGMSQINQQLQNPNLDAGDILRNVTPILEELAAYNKQEEQKYKDRHGVSYDKFQSTRK